MNKREVIEAIRENIDLENPQDTIDVYNILAVYMNNQHNNTLEKTIIKLLEKCGVVSSADVSDRNYPTRYDKHNPHIFI